MFLKWKNLDKNITLASWVLIVFIVNNACLCLSNFEWGWFLVVLIGGLVLVRLGEYGLGFIFRKELVPVVIIVLMIPLLFFFPIVNRCIVPVIPGLRIRYQLLIVVLVCMMIIYGVYLLDKHYSLDRYIKNITLFAKRAMQILVILLAAKGVKDYYTVELPFLQRQTLVPSFSKTKDSCNIFLLVLDERPSEKTLKKYFEYSDPLGDKLSEYGFTVYPHAVSKYTSTYLSLTSLLNYGINTGHTNYFLNISKINDPEWVNDLKNNGYGFEEYSIFDINHTAMKNDKKAKLFSRRNFAFQLFNNTFLWNWLLFRLKTFDEYNQRGICFLKEKLIQSTILRRQLVYTHLLIPHAPYTKDSIGNYKYIDNNFNYLINNTKLQIPYLDYIKYCNKVVTELYESIKNDTTNLYIITSDHGARFNFMEEEDKKNTFTAIKWPKQIPIDSIKSHPVNCIQDIPGLINQLIFRVKKKD
ncbi:hypothetical protein EZS27_029083 [termite gut metagenome]|uniref:Sulfatase N-terminal domain-containing protein n=1 Tax=termite gut metagenome TaxID=433724 RepID=A0A5J4QKU8_9ZZZZ